MKFTEYFLIGIFGIILLLVSFSSYYFKGGAGFFNHEEIKSFDTDTLFLKVAMKEGGVARSNIKITNLQDIEKYFVINVGGVSDLTSLNLNEFNLDSGELREIQVDFNAQNRTSGIYFGKLEISSGESKRKIPIVLEVQSQEVFFDSNINLFPSGGDIVQGQKLNAEIKMFDLSSIGRSSVILEYFIKDCDGRTISSESENLIIDGKLDYSKIFDLPKDIQVGNYILGVVLKYGDSVGTSSVFFKIIEEPEKQSGNVTLVFIIIIFSFFFLMFFGLFIYSLIYKDRLLVELQNQYKGELRRQRELIKGREKIDCEKLKSVVEKREYKKEVKKVEKEREKELKKIQKERVIKYHKIKNKNQARKQIEGWKKQGYDTRVLEKKHKIPTVESIKRKINQWKKQGYDTRILEKSKK